MSGFSGFIISVGQGWHIAGRGGLDRLAGGCRLLACGGGTPSFTIELLLSPPNPRLDNLTNQKTLYKTKSN